MVDTPVGTTKGGSNQGVSPGQPQRPDAEHELGKGAYPDYKGEGDNPNPPPKSGNPLDVPSPHADDVLRYRGAGFAGQLQGRGEYLQGIQPTTSPPVQRDDHPTHPYGTDKNYDDPADANVVDMEAAGEAGHEAAPAPFRKRDQFPDITTESVNMRMDQDYYPADRGRHQNGDLPRARAGELVAFPPDEALALKAQGVAHREDEFADEMAVMPVDNILERNERLRNETAGERWGNGQKVASIPIHIWQRELAEAQREGDDKYVNRWLNDSDHRKFRTKDGKV
jgi:hypothetical protein